MTQKIHNSLGMEPSLSLRVINLILVFSEICDKIDFVVYSMLKFDNI